MFRWLMQWRYPREFRIASFPLSVADLVAETERVIEALRKTSVVTTATVPDARGFTGFAAGQLAELATGLWRLRSKMIDEATGKPLDEMRRAFRHLESTWDVLAQGGLEIQDHSQSPYDPGLSLKVLTFQQTAGLVRETVIETIKPTVYLNGERIQIGEVVVGKP